MGRLLVGAAVGTADDTLERVKALIETKVDILTVDTSHGHSKKVMSVIDKIRNKFPEVELIAGNIATAQAAEDLINIGVDAVKVGIGPGFSNTGRF